MMLVSRLAVTVATLALLVSNPAAAQAPKLSPQQLNPAALNVNKPIAAPKVYSPNQIKPITAAPITVRRPVPDNNPRPMAHGSIASGTITYSPPPRAYGHKYDPPGASPFRNADKVPPAIPDPETAAQDRAMSEIGSALSGPSCIRPGTPGC